MPQLEASHWTTIIAALVACFGAVAAAALAFLGAWLKARADSHVAKAQATAQAAITKAEIDARIDARLLQENEELNAKVEALEKKVEHLERREGLRMGAVARIFRAIANQWPGDHGPDLDPADIALIEDAVPPRWIRARPTKEE